MAKTQIRLSPPLTEGLDYKINVIDRTEMVVTLLDGRRWRSDDGPLTITLMNTRGDEAGWFSIGGENGVHVAEIVDDIDADVTGGMAPTKYLSPTSAPAIGATYFTYLGCYADAMDDRGQNRGLPFQLSVDQSGYNECFRLGHSKQLRYVGLKAWNRGWQTGKNAGECWGWNSFDSEKHQGMIKNCQQQSTKDGIIMWGSDHSFALYELSSNNHDNKDTESVVNTGTLDPTESRLNDGAKVFAFIIVVILVAVPILYFFGIPISLVYFSAGCCKHRFKRLRRRMDVEMQDIIVAAAVVHPLRARISSVPLGNEHAGLIPLNPTSLNSHRGNEDEGHDDDHHHVTDGTGVIFSVELGKLVALLDRGYLTQEEFQIAKNNLLQRRF